MPGLKYNSNGHSNHLVPVYAKGNGAELFSSLAARMDPVRGPYVDNTEVCQVMRAAMTNGVRNVILMISDGAGFNTFAAASYYQYGELGRQAYDQFPVRLACSTYPLSTSSAPTASTAAPEMRGWYDQSIWAGFYRGLSNATDSAAAATALSCGVKTYNNAICWSDDNRRLTNIAELAKSLGRRVGVLTTVEFSHATPAGFSAHNVSRNNYQAIAAEQLTGPLVDVLMGAGHPLYTDNGVLAGGADYTFVGGADLWKALADGSLGWSLIQEKADFEALAAGTLRPSGRVCGVVQERSTTQQSRGGNPYVAAGWVPFHTNAPTLATMVRGALQVLADGQSSGLFLMAEGGAVDWANHAGQAGRMIEEQVDFNRAVETVVDWVDRQGGWSDTLLIVTADHETGMLYGPGAEPAVAYEPVALEPAGTAGVMAEHRPVNLAWSPVLGATGYVVSVTAPAGISSQVVAANWLTLADGAYGAYQWTVTPVNESGPGPASTNAFLQLIPALAAPPPQTIDELVPWHFATKLADGGILGAPLSFTLGPGAPQGVALDAVSGWLTWTPTEEQGPATNTITVIAQDSSAPSQYATNQMVVVVREINQAPALITTGDLQISELATLTLTNQFSDGDIPANRLSWKLLAAPEGFQLDAATGIMTWTPTEWQGPGVYEIAVELVDDGRPALPATNSFKITVLEANSPPSVFPMPNQVIDEAALMQLQVRASDPDFPTQQLVYHLLPGAPAGMLLNELTGLLTWYPTESQSFSTNRIGVVATDDGQPPLSATNFFFVVVRGVNTAPRLQPIANRTMEVGDRLTITNVANDPDTPPSALAFYLAYGPEGATINEATGVLTWTPGAAWGGTTNYFRILVADDATPPGTDSQQFKVIVNRMAKTPVLQSADSILGPYGDEPSAIIDETAKTCSLSLAERIRFYRLRSDVAFRIKTMQITGAEIRLTYE
jgi:alkaline phosphatase